MKSPAHSSDPEATIEDRILTLCQTRGRIMFSDLAAALPAHTWHALFSALGRLTRRHCIELIPHQWDYEVVLVPGGRSGSSSSPRKRDRYDHNERPSI